MLVPVVMAHSLRSSTALHESHHESSPPQLLCLLLV